MVEQKSRILAHYPLVIERLLRHGWVVAGVGGVAMLGMVTAFALAPSGADDHVQRQLILEDLATPALQLVDIGNASFLREERIQRSDTVSSLITRLGIADPAAMNFIRNSLEAQVISRQLRPGKVVTAKTNEIGGLLALYFPLNGKDATLVIEPSGSGFTASEQALKLETQRVARSGEIRNSLFGATDAAGIPDAIAIQLAEIFSADIDFYRDLRKGDRFSLVYEVLSQRGQTVRTGRILAAEFTNDQKAYSAYWFQSEDGKGGYYSADGKSLRKAFLRSPLEFSRVTSGFSSARLLPVLNVMRAHKGIDYGAPTGTRVRSVSDGTVEFAGRQGGFGNLVIIKHQGVYSTAYGHLNGFAAGIRKGTRVSQGDTIGYVGQTGLATGTHLHYEFRVNAQQVNPLAVALPSTVPLAAAQIGQFRSLTAPLRNELAVARQQINLATLE